MSTEIASATDAPGATPTTTTEPPATTPPPAPTVADPADLPDAVREVLAKERRAARDAEARAKAAEARLREIDDKDKTDLEREREERAKAEARAEAANLALWRTRAAAKHGLAPSMADRLRGTTEDEILDDARALTEDLTKVTAANEPRPRPVRTGTATSGDESDDPEQRYAQHIAGVIAGS